MNVYVVELKGGDEIRITAKSLQFNVSGRFIYFETDVSGIGALFPAEEVHACYLETAVKKTDKSGSWV